MKLIGPDSNSAEKNDNIQKAYRLLEIASNFKETTEVCSTIVLHNVAFLFMCKVVNFEKLNGTCVLPS